MENKHKKFLYDIAGGILGIGLIIALTAAIYAHLWLGEFEGPGADIITILSEEAASEKKNMEDMRLFGTVGVVVLLSLLGTLSRPYYQLVDDPRWEAKKGIGAGLFDIALGTPIYFMSSELVGESMGLALVFIGLLATVWGAGYLMWKEPE